LCEFPINFGGKHNGGTNCEQRFVMNLENGLWCCVVFFIGRLIGWLRICCCCFFGDTHQKLNKHTSLPTFINCLWKLRFASFLFFFGVLNKKKFTPKMDCAKKAGLNIEKWSKNKGIVFFVFVWIFSFYREIRTFYKGMIHLRKQKIGKLKLLSKESLVISNFVLFS